MAKSHHQLLADSLKRVNAAAKKGIVQAKDISRLDRERLEADEWLTRIIKGWYLLKQPNLPKGESTRWYASYWDFISIYLKSRFKNTYCLSANDSINLHLGSTIISKQILVMVKQGGSSIVDLPFDTSIAIYQETKTFPESIVEVNATSVMPLSLALTRVSPQFFQEHSQSVEIALKLVNSTDLTRDLLKSKNIAAANRIIGAYNFFGDKKTAKKIQSSLNAAGLLVNPIDSFATKKPYLQHLLRVKSPYAARITALWESMRNDIISIFPKEPGQPRAKKKYINDLEFLFVTDAYNSLSIEGYDVSKTLIDRIAHGIWNPDNFQADQQRVNMLAASGYRLTFDEVKKSIGLIFKKENPGKVFKDNMAYWYNTLFSPSVKAGLLEASHLAGYRDHQVYIRGSQHVPLPAHALMDAMDSFFKCLIKESSSSVRAVLGHFIFVFIHPYMDGNGRIARFLMNAMFASGGFPWTIVKVADRAAYFSTLEKASVQKDIKPFAKFIYKQMLNNKNL